MLSWFRKKHVTVEPAHVWLTATAKFAGILKLVQRARHQYRAVLIIGHFADTLAHLVKDLRKEGIDFIPFEKGMLTAYSLPPKGEPAPVWLAGADLFTYTESPAEHWDQDKAVAILVADRYPIPEPEALLEAYAEGLPYKVSLTYCCALDDPLIRGLIDGHSMSMLTSNLRRGECLTHRMIGNSIRTAQKKIAAAVPREVPADSAQKWFQANLPDGLK